MKNKKIIFLVAIVCCLVVAFACFCGFAPSTSTSTSYKVYFNFGDTVVSVSDLSFLYVQRYNSNSSYTVTTNNSYFSASQFDTNTIVVDVTRDSSLSRDFYIYCFSSSTSRPMSIGSAELYNSSGSIATSSIFAYGSNFVKFYAYSSSTTSTTYNGYIVANCSFVSGGGVSQEQYDDVVDQLEQQQLINDQLSNDNLTLQEDLNALQVNYNQVSQQLAQAEQNYTNLQTEFSNLQTEFSNLQTSYNQVVNDRDSWERYAHGIEEQLDELYVSNERLQRDYDNLLREYNIIISENESIGFVERAFLAVGNILEIEILPNVSIGTIVSVPLILGVVFLVLRLVRGE